MNKRFDVSVYADDAELSRQFMLKETANNIKSVWSYSRNGRVQETVNSFEVSAGICLSDDHQQLSKCHSSRENESGEA